MKERDLGAAIQRGKSVQRKRFETEAPIKQLECDLQAAVQMLQKTRRELEDSEQLNETLEGHIEALDGRLNKPEYRLREAEAVPTTARVDSATNTRAASNSGGQVIPRGRDSWAC